MNRWVRRTRAVNDDGSVLVMALIFLSIFGMLIAIVLGFAQTGFKTSASGRTIAGNIYAAEGAVDTVINTRRADLTFGLEGTDVPACFAMPASVNNTPVSVRCTGRVGSGSGNGVGGGLKPAHAVLTLPTNATEGITQTATSSVSVSGDALTNQRRTTPAGARLNVAGRLTCRTVTGTGVVTATTLACPTAAPGGVNPGYAALVTQNQPLGVVPACAAGPTITFPPGRYSDALTLNALMQGACAGKTFHFQPGVYYFQFTNAGTREWRINDATAAVVGGTLTASPFPNRCDLAQAGVQFIFGADSRIAVSNGTLELCPPLSAGQRIALYGVPATTPTSAVTTTPLAPTTAANTGAQPFTAPANGAVVDGARATIALCNLCGAVLNVTGFPATIPANATITSASLRITHDRGPATGTVTARVISADATLTNYAANPCAVPCAGVTTINVLGQVSTPARANGIRVEYRATDTAGGGAYSPRVDGMVLTIAYRIDGLVVQGGCIVSVPYSPTVPATCAVLKTTGGASSRMAIKGTVFATRAAVDLSATGQVNAVTQRGIIARTLYLGMAPAVGYTGALIGMPPVTDRRVLLTASVAGVPALRADVTFVDGGGSTPGASVQVTSWSVLR